MAASHPAERAHGRRGRRGTFRVVAPTAETFWSPWRGRDSPLKHRGRPVESCAERIPIPPVESHWRCARTRLQGENRFPLSNNLDSRWPCPTANGRPTAGLCAGNTRHPTRPFRLSITVYIERPVAGSRPQYHHRAEYIWGCGVHRLCLPSTSYPVSPGTGLASSTSLVGDSPRHPKRLGPLSQPQTQ